MQPCRAHERFIPVISDATRTCAFQGTSPLFEAWLQSDLQRLYDRMLVEPVPEELLQLVLLSQEPESKQP